MKATRSRRVSRPQLDQSTPYGLGGDSERKEQILNAAVRMFWENGYQETSIQDIADAAGLGKSSLYHYIRSKEQLLYEIHDSFINHLNERVTVLAESDLPPREKLEGVIVDAVEVVARYRPLVSIFLAEMRSLSTARMRRIAAKRDAYEQTVTAIIDDGVRSGAFRAANPKIISLSILGMLNWTHQWLRGDGPLSPREVGLEMARLVLDGLQASPNGRAC